jgi:hypothetical protein
MNKQNKKPHHLFGQTICNSFVFYFKNSVLKNHLQFRIELAELMIQKHHSDGNSKPGCIGIEHNSLNITNNIFFG